MRLDQLYKVVEDFFETLSQVWSYVYYYDEAREYLLKARQAPPRPDRTLADAGRQQEITELLEEIADE